MIGSFSLNEVLTLVIAAVGAVAAVTAVFAALYVSYQAAVPKVVVHIEGDVDNSAYYLVISNFSNGVTRNVRLENFDYSVVAETYRDLVSDSFLDHGIPMLVPSASRRTIIAAGGCMDDLKNQACNVTVAYEKGRWIRRKKRRTVREEYLLDCSAFAGSLFSSSDMHLIRRELEKMNKQLDTIMRRLGE